jgi:hypothetical protein
LGGEEIMPRTKLGKWTFGLAIAFLVVFYAHLKFDRLGGYLSKSPQALISEIGAMITGVAAFIAGLVSLIKYKDRSFLVILATIVGFLATLLYAAWVADFVFS